MADHDPAVDQNHPGESGTVTDTYDWSTTHPSTAVVETVAAATGVEPTALDTLQHTIDADALDTLVREAEADSEFTVEFRYHRVGVRVTSGGTVGVTLD